VRCVGGALKRLFVMAAVGGSITAPDFGAGDPTVLGGCPASSTFNATQTGQVSWWP